MGKLLDVWESALQSIIQNPDAQLSDTRRVKEECSTRNPVQVPPGRDVASLSITAAYFTGPSNCHFRKEIHQCRLPDSRRSEKGYCGACSQGVSEDLDALAILGAYDPDRHPDGDGLNLRYPGIQVVRQVRLGQNDLGRSTAVPHYCQITLKTPSVEIQV